MIDFLLDVVYLIGVLLAAPWLLYKAITTGKYRVGWREKWLGRVPTRTTQRPCVWFHAVSVGEVLLLNRVVAELVKRRPDVEIVISTTTNTGMEVAQKQFGESSHGTRSVPATLVYFPLDFSWAVHRAVRRIRPDVVALAELELWPNFIAAAHRFGARIAVINGRMSPRSCRGYGRIRLLMRRLLRQIDTFAVQTREYADRFVNIGAPAERVIVTGSVKYDGVETDKSNPRTTELRSLFQLQADEQVWVAGSTSEPEEGIVLEAYERLRTENPKLRLILVPRHKERFDEVARLIASRGMPLLRRSEIQRTQYSVPSTQYPEFVARHPECTTHEQPRSPITDHRSPTPDHRSPTADHRSPTMEHHSPLTTHHSPIILVDTLGELSAVWGLADIAFVGGSFAPRGGQNMIEPAGYGAAVVFGPGVWNFQDTVDHLLDCGGAVQVATPTELERLVGELLGDPGRRKCLGSAARQFVLSQRGATTQTVGLLQQLIDSGRIARSRQAA